MVRDPVVRAGRVMTSVGRLGGIGLGVGGVTDTIMTHVEMQCGPHTVVSLMSTEAPRELKLEPGSLAVAVIKATTVIVETPENIS